MDMTTFTLTTLVRLRMPEEIEVAGIKAVGECCEDGDGDYVEYIGFDPDYTHEWDINIWMSGQDANIRASIDGDEIDTAVVDITQGDDLTAVIAELCKEIEKELAKGE